MAEVGTEERCIPRSKACRGRRESRAEPDDGREVLRVYILSPISLIPIYYIQHVQYMCMCMYM